MAFEIRDTLFALSDILRSGGYVSDVSIGEPDTPPAPFSFASIFMRELYEGATSLSGSMEEHGVVIRIYLSWLNSNKEPIELEMASIVSNILADIAGAFTLSGTVRNVDFGGERRDPVHVKWDYKTVGGSDFRTADMYLGLLVDDSATYVA